MIEVIAFVVVAAMITFLILFAMKTLHDDWKDL